jgi:hypothetical protein
MESIVLFPLFGLIYEDFKRRSIPLWLLLLFGVFQLIASWWHYGIGIVSVNLLLNLSALSVIGMSVALYIRLRFRGKQNAIGWGDILFIAFLTPLFELRIFLWFLIISLILSLIGWLLFSQAGKTGEKGIPLVSCVGICYATFILYELFYTLWT